jgi:hypothetical protein
MAMTKKEKARIEELLTFVALRYTADVGLPDIPIPDSGKKTQGYLPVGVAGDNPRVEPVESESVSHATIVKGVVLSTASQGGRALYSTRLLALKALRNEVEKLCAQQLRRIDVMIDEEIKIKEEKTDVQDH